MLKFIRDHELAALTLIAVVLIATVAAYVGDRIHFGRPEGWVEAPAMSDAEIDARLRRLNARHAESLGPNAPEVKCTDLK